MSQDDLSLNQRIKVNLTVKPVSTEIESLEKWQDAWRNALGDLHVTITNMHIVCDICQAKYPHVFAGIKTVRRKCSICSELYDICNNCFNGEICPWCHNIDLKF
jgi:hypothetical protein